MAPFDAHSNFAYSTVLTAPSPASSGTSLTLQSGDGAKFPAAPFNITVWPINLPPIASNAEICRVTAVTGDTLTITRSQEGTSARTILAGDQVINGITKKTFTDIENSLTPLVTDAAKFVNVLNYGAIGNGTTDDTAAIQSAINAAAGQARVDIPYGSTGTYLVSASLTLPSNSYLNIAAGVTIKLANGANTKVITNSDTVNGNTNITITGGTIDGNKTNQTAGSSSRGLYLVNVIDLYVGNLKVKNTEDHGVMLTSCDRFTLLRTVAHDCGLNGTTSIGGSGIAISTLTDKRGGDVISCDGYNNLRCGVKVGDGPSGPSSANYVPVNVVNFRATNNGSDGSSPGVSVFGNGSAFPIRGISVTGCESWLNLNDGYKIEAGVIGGRFMGNNARLNAKHGFHLLQAVSYNSFSGNTSTENSTSSAGTYSGFFVEDTGGGCLHNLFSNNIGTDQQTTKTQAYGFAEANLTDYSTLTGNDFSGNLTGTVSFIGLNSKVTDSARSTTTITIATLASGYTADYICNGTNDSSQVQAALLFLGTTGGEIRLRAGTYNFSTGVSTSNSNVTITGEGQNTIIQWKTGTIATGGYLITIAGFSQISNLNLQGNNTNVTGGSAIYIYQGTRVWLDKLHIISFNENGIVANGTSSSLSSHANKYTNIYIKFCTGYGIWLQSYTYDSQLINIWVGSSGVGMRVESGECFISNTHLWGNTGNGLEIRSTYNRIVSGYFETNNGNGIDINNQANNEIVAVNCRANLGYGISLAVSSARTIIADSHINDNHGPGINIANSNDWHIQNCIFWDDQAPKTQTYAVVSSGTSDYGIMSGNTIKSSDHLTGSSSLVGTNNIIGLNQV